MPQRPVSKLKVGRRVPWLPGYVVFIDKNKSTQKSLIGMKKSPKENEEKLSPTLRIEHFTLVYKSDFDIYKNIASGFELSTESLKEKHQAQLAFGLNRKKWTKKWREQQSMTDAIVNSSEFKSALLELEKTYAREDLLTIKKKSTSPFKERTVPKPFAYFGNSINYLEKIEKILATSETFGKATVIKDATCGSCTLTFYLADRYPDKRYIASDINSEIINLLNYIKNTPYEKIKESYTEHHKRVFQFIPHTAQTKNSRKLLESTDSGKEQMKSIYDKMKAEYLYIVKEFNDQPDNNKDYSLLLFLQNNAYTNVKINIVNGKRILTAELRSRNLPELKNKFHHLQECKRILGKGHIEFQISDMRDVIATSEPTDMIFLTPPHEHDNRRLYADSIDRPTLVTQLNNLHQHNIPFLLTYGDNASCTTPLFTQREIKEIDSYPFIIFGGIEKWPKTMRIYTSKDLLSEEHKKAFREELARNIQKQQKQATQNIQAFNTTANKNKNVKTTEIETRIQKLAQKILAELNNNLNPKSNDGVKQKALPCPSTMQTTVSSSLIKNNSFLLVNDMNKREREENSSSPSEEEAAKRMKA